MMLLQLAAGHTACVQSSSQRSGTTSQQHCKLQCSFWNLLGVCKDDTGGLTWQMAAVQHMYSPGKAPPHIYTCQMVRPTSGQQLAAASRTTTLGVSLLGWLVPPCTTHQCTYCQLFRQPAFKSQCYCSVPPQDPFSNDHWLEPYVSLDPSRPPLAVRHHASILPLLTRDTVAATAG
jgi:hypothetical protein